MKQWTNSVKKHTSNCLALVKIWRTKRKNPKEEKSFTKIHLKIIEEIKFWFKVSQNIIYRKYSLTKDKLDKQNSQEIQIQFFHWLHTVVKDILLPISKEHYESTFLKIKDIT